MKTLRTLFLVAVGLSPLASLAAPPQAHGPGGPSYIPQRVYQAADQRFGDFEAMLADLARADVVFVGEQHNDGATHRLELALLEGLARRRPDVVVALEMFERDAQPALDDYLAGRINEEAFLQGSRPWPNYATDYRPLVEFAKAKGWRVVAGNVPRRYASGVAKTGLKTLEALPEAERALVARDISCPQDDYYKRVAAAAHGHPGGNLSAEDQRALVERFYHAQCVKDETMAESVAKARAAAPQALIIHYNGAFHSDYGQGAAARVKRRLPDARLRVVSFIPAPDLDALKPEADGQRGDYVVYTLKPPAKAHPAR